MNEIIEGDCLQHFESVADGSVNLVFCDPPFNIGYDYGEDGYDDTMSDSAYLSWSRQWLQQVYRVLADDGTFWLMIGDEQAAELKVLACRAGFHLRSWVIWYYTFGVNATRKFSRSHVHLLYFVKSKTDFTFNVDAVRVPSARMLKYNDKRANPKGRLPDDTWVLQPTSLEGGFAEDSDTWLLSRVCGTFKERVEGAANQIPEQLLGRVIRACSNENDVVLDPMAGTGTTVVVAKKLGRKYLGFEQSSRMAGIAQSRLAAVNVGDPLEGRDGSV